MSEIEHSLRELRDRDNCVDWAAKVEDVCEKSWDLIRSVKEKEGVERERPWVEQLVSLLHDKDALELAKLVIPELRTVSTSSDSNGMAPLQQYIIQQLRHGDAARLSRSIPTETGDELYQQEKEIFTEAEVYRASVLLYNTGTLSIERRKEVEDWLRLMPR
jgi:hypothetical protein